jgi:hypothetical protein
MQCPNCGSFHTKSGKDKLKSEFLPLIILAFLTAGLGIVLALPYLLIQAAGKHYTFYRYRCDTCNYVWGESELKKLAGSARAFALTQEQSKIQSPRRMALASLVLVAVGFGLALLLAPLGNQPGEGGQPTSPTILPFAVIAGVIAVVGCILFYIMWFWVIRIAWKRGQGGWALFLILGNIIVLPFYLILNPVPVD